LTQVHWPYTYFGRLPLRLTPAPAEGLSALIVERATASRGVGLALTAAAGRGLDKIPGATVWASVSELTVEADPPAPFQADGELWGRLGELRITNVPDALLVAAP
jgi:diacylglycerol kinase family enzyme